MKKLLCLLMGCILLSLSGCAVFDMLRIPEQKKIDFEGKALLCYCDEPQPQSVQVMDQLFVINEKDHPENRTTLVSGYFEKYAYAEGKLIVYTELTYHVLDVDAYEFPSAATAGSYDAWRAYMATYYQRLSISEFEERFPQQDSFAWVQIQPKPDK